MLKLRLKRRRRTWRVVRGDCVKVLQCLQILPELELGFDALVTDPPAGIGFMGKSWDHDKGGRTEWVAWLERVMTYAIRVLKPGAHGLVWALPRTSHWTATALENAGFEIRDIITHHFGTGFPKSLDVSKAIDTAAGAKRKVVGKSLRHVSGKPNQRTEGLHGSSTFAETIGMGMYTTAPSTAGAKQWAGYGTALKPATEHWILIRKPFTGTVATNVQRHGTGAINIDQSRIGTTKRSPGSLSKTPNVVYGVYGPKNFEMSGYNTNIGRWPANLILSHSEACSRVCAKGCPIRRLDKQSGVLNSPAAYRRNVVGHASPNPMNRANRIKDTRSFQNGFGDKGGASRFFYCAKPSRKERNAGLKGVNKHPTVKSKSLMRYLIRMITPPGGTILDLFCGSGTTGVAAVENGWRFFGVEQDREYAAIARDRIAAAEEDL